MEYDDSDRKRRRAPELTTISAAHASRFNQIACWIIQLPRNRYNGKKDRSTKGTSHGKYTNQRGKMSCTAFVAVVSVESFPAELTSITQVHPRLKLIPILTWTSSTSILLSTTRKSTFFSSSEEVGIVEGRDFFSTSDSGTKHTFTDLDQRRLFEDCSPSVVSDRNVAGNGPNNGGSEYNELFAFRTLWRKSKIFMDRKMFFAHLSISGSVCFSVEQFDLVSRLLLNSNSYLSLPTYKTVLPSYLQSLLSFSYPASSTMNISGLLPTMLMMSQVVVPIFQNKPM